MSVLKNTQFQSAEPKRQRKSEDGHNKRTRRTLLPDAAPTSPRSHVEETIEMRRKAAEDRGDGSFVDLVSPPASPASRSPPASPASRSPPASPNTSLCKICQNNDSDVVLKPCNHFCVCHQCAKHAKTCPMCKEHILRRIQLRPVSPSSESEDSSDSEDGYIARCNACGFTWDGNAQHICDSPEILIYLNQSNPPFDMERVASVIDEIVHGYVTKEADGRYVIRFQASGRYFAKIWQNLKKMNIRLDPKDEDEYQAKVLDISPYRLTEYQYNVLLEDCPYNDQAVIDAVGTVLDYDNDWSNIDGTFTFMKRGARESFVKAAAALASIGLKLENFGGSGGVEKCDIAPMDLRDPRYAKMEACIACGERSISPGDRHDECETCRHADRTCDGCDKVVSSPRYLIDKGEGEQLCEMCSRNKHPGDWPKNEVSPPKK